ncbi:MAG: hypothetical protein H6Q10_2841 [Acidobacteria bacterium]|nr:hypothetical protein [Acidobacteriota bacterium]
MRVTFGSSSPRSSAPNPGPRPTVRAMSAAACAAYASPPMRASTRLARSACPDPSSHRGLSGTNSAPAKNRSAGAVTAVNIHRQPSATFQAARAASASAAPGNGSRTAITQLTICADRIPTTIVSWLTATSRPRRCGGATSAMYIGDRFDAMPMAAPPAMRHATNAPNEPAHPVSTDEPAKSSAEATSSRLRPKRSQRAPVASDPARQPTSAHEFAHPTWAAVVRPKLFSKNGFAPPMTTQS